MAAVKFPVVSSVLFWNSAPLLLTYQHITTASVDKWQRVTLIYVLERHFGSTMKQLSYSRTQQTDCLLMQPVSIEVQHHTCPSKIRWPRWCCPVISQVILCVFSRYYGRLSCSESRIAFFSCSSDVRVVLHWAGLSRYSMKVAIFYLVHSTQNKPYPSLCETYQSLYNQKCNNTNTQQKDFCFRIKVRFPDALRLGRVNLSRSVNPT